MAPAVGALAVDLDQHRVIDIAAERALHGFQIRFQAVGGQLDPVGQSRPHVVHQLKGRPAGAIPHQPRHHELAVAVDGGPGPCVAGLLGRGLGPFHRFVLAVGERPDLVALDAACPNVPDPLVMQVGGDRSGVPKQLS